MKNSPKFIKLLSIISIIVIFSTYFLTAFAVKVNADDYDEDYDRYEEGYKNGYDVGYNDGSVDGYHEGYENGYNNGYEDGSAGTGYTDEDVQRMIDDALALYKETSYSAEEVEALVNDAYENGYEIGFWDGAEINYEAGYEEGFEEGKSAGGGTRVEKETKIVEKYYPVQSKAKPTVVTAEQIMNDNSITNKMVVNATDLYNYSFESAYRSAVDPMKFVIVGGNTWKIYRIQ